MSKPASVGGAPVHSGPLPSQILEHVCLSCQAVESEDAPGMVYRGQAENGMRVTFWLCDGCATKLGPDQGPITWDDPESGGSEPTGG